MRFFNLSDIEQKLQLSFQFEKIDEYCLMMDEVDVREFLVHLKSDHSTIFMGWIEQWAELNRLLKNQAKQVVFQDELKLSEHRFYNEFKQFVTPFLQPILEQKIEVKDFESLRFIVLLNDGARSKVEQSFTEGLLLDMQKNSSLISQLNCTEDQWKSALQLMADDSIISLFNVFSSQSYGYLLQYVEKCLAFTALTTCKATYGSWILSQLQKLNLHDEHKAQIIQLKEDVRSKRFVFKGDSMSSSKLTNNRKKNQLVIGSLLLVLAIGLFILKPWKQAPIKENEEEIEVMASFKAFTPEERKQLDSLIKIIQPENMAVQEALQDFTEGRELYVDARKQVSNEVVNSFYDQWEKYINSDSLNVKGRCEKSDSLTKKSDLPSGFKPLKSKNKGMPAFISNESEYAVQLLVFRANSKEAFYLELKPKAFSDFKLSEGDYLAVIAGKYSISYNQSIVMCQFDEVTITNLLTTYRVNQQHTQSNKFIVSGSSVQDFQLVDLYGTLTKY